MPQVPPPKRHPYDQWSPDARALDLVGDKWTLLIVRDLSTGPRRFVDLQRVLPGISTEQLRSRLNRMVADQILTRTRYREVPPRVDYALTTRARDLLPVLTQLARWGYRWTWGAPHGAERVDLGAIFRLAPGLIDATRCRESSAVSTDAHLYGSVRCAVTDGLRDGSPFSSTVYIDDRCSRTTEQDQAHADAEIDGDHHTWVDVIARSERTGRLRISGNHELANRLLACIAAPASGQGAIAAHRSSMAGANEQNGVGNAEPHASRHDGRTVA